MVILGENLESWQLLGPLLRDPSDLPQEFWKTPREGNMEKSSACCNWDAASSSLKGEEAAGESAVKWNGWSIL